MKLVAAHEEMKRSCQEKAFTHGALVAGLGQDVPTLELLNLFTNGSGVVVSSFHLSLKLCDVLTVLLKGVAYRTLEVINDHEVWKETITNYNILCLLFNNRSNLSSPFSSTFEISCVQFCLKFHSILYFHCVRITSF